MKFSRNVALLGAVLLACQVAVSQADDPSCTCTWEFNPQCGTDFKTYDNPCLAKCEGVEIAHPGECEVNSKEVDPLPPTKRDACSCTKESNPQCGIDGKTYANPCLAQCAGVAIIAPGNCLVTDPFPPTKSPACLCTKELNPQCGVDGKTYENPCLAKCANAEPTTPGPCAVEK